MKKISYILLLAISIFALNSCQNDIAGTNELDYVSFGNNPVSITVEKNSSTTVDIHLYATQVTNADRTFNIMVTDATTLDPSSYTAVPSTIVIPANSNDGIITVTFSDTNLSEDPQIFALQIEDVPGLPMEGKFAATINKKCPLTSGVSDLVGSFTLTTDTSGIENDITTELDGENLTVYHLGEYMMTDGWWGEQITDGGPVTMQVDPDTGALNIPRQYYMSTLYNGAPSTYEIEGSGKWNNCGASPTLQLTYEVYYTGDATGIGEDYWGSAFGGIWTKD